MNKLKRNLEIIEKRKKGLSFKCIAKKLHISPVRVRQIFIRFWNKDLKKEERIRAMLKQRIFFIRANWDV